MSEVIGKEWSEEVDRRVSLWRKNKMILRITDGKQIVEAFCFTKGEVEIGVSRPKDGVYVTITMTTKEALKLAKQIEEVAV